MISKLRSTAGFTAWLMVVSINLLGQSEIKTDFDKIIISPFIQVTLVEGDKEQVVIEQCTVERSKLHIDINNRTLWIYLEGAKDFPKNETIYNGGNKEKYPIYHGTTVIATITYKKLNELSIRGEEAQVCQSPISVDKFFLKIYGESKVIFNQVNIGVLQAKLYGESFLEIKSGAIKEQRFTSYGESVINSIAAKGESAYITTYGDSDFTINVSGNIKVNAFGEAKIHYKGDPEIIKGFRFGEVHIDKIE